MRRLCSTEGPHTRIAVALQSCHGLGWLQHVRLEPAGRFDVVGGPYDADGGGGPSAFAVVEVTLHGMDEPRSGCWILVGVVRHFPKSGQGVRCLLVPGGKCGSGLIDLCARRGPVASGCSPVPTPQ